MIEYLDEAALTQDRSGRLRLPSGLPLTLNQVLSDWETGYISSLKMTTLRVDNDGTTSWGVEDDEEAFETKKIERQNSIVMLKGAKMWYVKKEACELIRFAAQSLDTNITPVPEVHLGNHFIWLEQPYVLKRPRGSGCGEVDVVDAISSSVGMANGKPCATFLCGYSWEKGILLPTIFTEWPHDENWAGSVDIPLPHMHLKAMFHSARSLIVQKGLFTVDDGIKDASRAERRRALRSGAPLDQVKVVYLGQHHKTADHSGAGTKLSTRFIVSGHWRNQRCGPGNKYTRTIWISPHIKGPEDAPLVISSKVTVVK